MVRDVNLGVQTQVFRGNRVVGQGEIQWNDRVGEWAQLRTNRVIAADPDLDRFADWTVKDQLGADRSRENRDGRAEKDLEGDELVPRRMERDPSSGGVPEMIGGQVSIGLGGD